jgi:hypothetical protein
MELKSIFIGIVAKGRTIECDGCNKGPGSKLSFTDEREFNSLVAAGYLIEFKDEEKLPTAKPAPKKRTKTVDSTPADDLLAEADDEASSEPP